MKLVSSPFRLRRVALLHGRFFSATCSGRDAQTSSSSTQLAQDVEQRSKQQQRKTKTKIFSAIQPTGIPHLGNYLGALRKWKELQAEKLASRNPKQYQLLFAIADLHALTVRQDAAQFQRQRLETYASLLAIGLDFRECDIFVQSAIPQHTQFMWILSTLASTGYLSRMTQWKSKLGLDDSASLSDNVATENLKLGLFSYPVLQAADILLYRPDYVPVGEDQAQHVEFTRTLARSFNAHYGLIGKSGFTPPELLLSTAKRVMSLKEPHKKMSKSHQDPMSRILVTDSAEDINNKIKRALTDSTEGISYDPTNRPGVSNLVEILNHTSHSDQTCEDIAADNANVSMRAFKELVAQSVIKELDGICDRFHEVTDPRNQTLKDSLIKGNSKAKSIAGQTMNMVDQLIGLGDISNVERLSGSSQSTDEPVAQSLKDKVKQEQMDEEKAQVDEPDVLPQKEQGVDHPIAS